MCGHTWPFLSRMFLNSYQNVNASQRLPDTSPISTVVYSLQHSTFLVAIQKCYTTITTNRIMHDLCTTGFLVKLNDSYIERYILRARVFLGDCWRTVVTMSHLRHI